MVSTGEDTEVHSITLPERYADYLVEYKDLLEKVDRGLTLFGTTTELEDIENNSTLPDDVLAYDVTEETFKRSSGGTWEVIETGEFSNPAEADLDMNNHNIENANSIDGDSVEASDALIVPGSFGL